MRTRVLLALALTAMIVLATAPAAPAVRTSVRAEGAAGRLIPRTVVWDGGGTYADTEGDSYTTTGATPFGALALAAALWATPWDFQVASFGVFVNGIAGQAMDPDTYENWWQFTTNGYSPPVGLAGIGSRKDDSYVLFQNPDAGYPPRGAALLVVRAAPSRGVRPGQALTLSVVADDVNQANSQSDAARFEAARVETPSQFQRVAGAVLHVGSRTYDLTTGSIAIDDLPNGTYGVWAEKPMDANWVYVRSNRTLVDVHPAPVVTRLRTVPARQRAGRPLTVSFRLNRSARVKLVVRDAVGRVLWMRSTSRRAGWNTIVWSGRSSRRTTNHLRLAVTATDSWGRHSTTRLRVPVR